MAALKNQIVELLRSFPGLTDRDVTDRIFGSAEGQQAVNQAARQLASAGRIVRRRREDGKIGNFLSGLVPEPGRLELAQSHDSSMLSEDDVKRCLKAWLEASGWRVSVVWGRAPGTDIHAQKDGRRWIIEAKGCGSLDAMRVNYFLSVLGELLQRMNDADARYSIALPAMKQFRRLWERLPELAKSRTKISVLFVNSSGGVEELAPPAREDSWIGSMAGRMEITGDILSPVIDVRAGESGGYPEPMPDKRSHQRQKR
jgi:hypothetical protein